MSASKAPVRLFLEESDGPLLVGIINHVVESFDITALSVEEAVLLYIMLDRLTDALWREYRRELMPIVLRQVMLSDADDDDDPEPGSSNEDTEN